jgi:hypothetical protein
LIAQSYSVLPFKPLKIYNNLSDKDFLKKYLGNKGGIYGIVHVKTSKQYIG